MGNKYEALVSPNTILGVIMDIINHIVWRFFRIRSVPFYVAIQGLTLDFDIIVRY